MQLGWFDNDVTEISAGFPSKMVLLDCETTGGNPTYSRIIEIGLFETPSATSSVIPSIVVTSK